MADHANGFMNTGQQKSSLEKRTHLTVLEINSKTERKDKRKKKERKKKANISQKTLAVTKHGIIGAYRSKRLK